MKKYIKTEAIAIVVKCAQIYKNELDGKTLLFICTDKHKNIVPAEFSFYGNNYRIKATQKVKRCRTVCQ